jgi:hypothetical protein
VDSVAGLETALFGLPDDMKVEVAPGVGISAQTVHDLRALKSVQGKLLLSWPWPRHPEHAVKVEIAMRRRMHQPIPEQGKWLNQVVTVYFNYHAVPTNGSTLTAFRFHVPNLWRRTLRRRSQKDWTTKERTARLANDWLPRTANPSPLARCALCSQTPKVGAVCRNRARTALCGGREVTRFPTAISICSPQYPANMAHLNEPKLPQQPQPSAEKPLAAPRGSVLDQLFGTDR